MVLTDIASPDYDKWLDQELWTLIEACCLCVAVEPVTYSDSTGTEEVFELIPVDSRDAAKDIYRKVKDANLTGSLEVIKAYEIVCDGHRSRPLRNSKVTPLGFVQWAANRGIKLPVELSGEAMTNGHATEGHSNGVPVGAPRWLTEVARVVALRTSRREKIRKITDIFVVELQSRDDNFSRTEKLPGSFADLQLFLKTIPGCQKVFEVDSATFKKYLGRQIDGSPSIIKTMGNRSFSIQKLFPELLEK